MKNLLQRKLTWLCLSLFSHHQSSLCFSNSNDLINFWIQSNWNWLNLIQNSIQLNLMKINQIEIELNLVELKITIKFHHMWLKFNSIYFGFNWKNWWIQIWNPIQFNLVESISIWLNWIECYWIEFCGLNQFLKSLENIHIKWWIFL